MLEAISEALILTGEVEVVVIKIAIIVCDMIGVLVLMTTVGKSVWNYFHRDRHVKLMLAQGIALALEFKLAGEVLRTVTVRDWNELVILGTIIALRGAITLLIHWEIKAEKHDAAEEKMRKLEYEETMAEIEEVKAEIAEIEEQKAEIEEQIAELEELQEELLDERSEANTKQYT
ncbi:MAG: DUF1622 domain-containing protein [Oscillospiraceae bacterium]|nr:DUF1622 domain-containing protein [Oscillospiraceae bacterium]